MSKILAEFDSCEATYRAFSKRLEQILADLLSDARIQIHSITCRIKDRRKLEEKIGSESGKYIALQDITDVAGIRITTYFSDDVDRISKIVEQEFEVDWANSIDKRATLDPDRFGYLSLHYVVSLNSNRAALSENRKFIGLKAEIQMRSILQHAWAEIEHDIGYKTNLAVPREIRRRFSRLAGLLELADSEFVAIRGELSTYSAKVEKEIQRAPESVFIDKASLTAFANSSAKLAAIDQQIAQLCSAKVNPELNPVVIESDVGALHFLEIHTIAELEDCLVTNEAIITAFARQWLSGKQTSVVQSVSILYLTYVLTGRTADVKYVRGALDVLHVGLEAERDEIAARVVATMRKVEPQT